MAQPQPPEQWACPACTLLNNVLLPRCTLCGAARPASINAKRPASSLDRLQAPSRKISRNKPKLSTASSQPQSPDTSAAAKGAGSGANTTAVATGAASASKNRPKSGSKASVKAGKTGTKANPTQRRGSDRFGTQRDGTPTYRALHHLYEQGRSATEQIRAPFEHGPWPKVIGECIVQGIANRSGRGLLSAGDALRFSYSLPDKRHSHHGTVTFGRDHELGTLSTQASLWLGPLLAAGAVRLTGTAIYLKNPEKLSFSDTIDISITIYGSPVAFLQRPDEAFAGNVATEGLEVTIITRAWQACFTNCGFIDANAHGGPALRRPSTADAATDSTQADETADRDGAQDEEGEENNDLQFICEQLGLDQTLMPTLEPHACVKSTLRPYQKQALWWLVSREQLSASARDTGRERQLHPLWQEMRFASGDAFFWKQAGGRVSVYFPHASQQARGGILADAMGLGKTVQSLALVATQPAPPSFIASHHDSAASNASSAEPLLGAPTQRARDSLSLDEFLDARPTRRSSDGSEAASAVGNALASSNTSGIPGSKATLIVCPVSLLSQWEEEVHQHLEGMKVLPYHAQRSTVTPALIWTEYDVVLTTYGVVTSEHMQHLRGQTSLLFGTHFWRIILDEGHMIRNRNTAGARACHELSARNRWVLTGTPIQNRLEDVYSLIRFLRVEPYAHFSYWRQHVQEPFERDEDAGISALQKILAPLLLRRTKHTKDETGSPIVQLPSSSVEVLMLEFSSAEREFYDAIFQRSKNKFDEFQAAGKVLNNYANILELLLRLRQACDHPFLTLRNMTQEEEAAREDKRLRTQARQGVFSDIDTLVAKFMSDSRQGNASLRADHVATMAEDLRYLLQRSSHGASAQQNQETKATEQAPPECSVCLDTIDEPVVTPCAHYGCRVCMENAVDNFHECPLCRKPLQRSSLFRIQAPDPDVESAATAPPNEDDRQHWLSSSKLKALLADLDAATQQPDRPKVIVFSQWTSMLDLIEVFLMTLRTGGVGLNLTAASHVILVDPWWSPAVEAQAIDRVHRIGQDKPVTIKRYIMRDSIEERILALQKRKRALVHSALTRNATERQAERMSDLKLLFGQF
ncbi:uncharacterized protein MONBRDRAFT_24613 [Monosiga brevicollis MX1]|uniref:RanBP-type and C3HC4-type zinc finger-containing protein 1 n=1 Tax=Monosiga brevicollis TaxID=81824 RepID=A9UWY8_MONBE|nr:uncharacterized protein MONBRDRAFT_24613 [Monosiga brevicollis MX1]EDQ90124.1 predicted protein [Monosiga brevicollis MX1]|eukprot:XP_001744891.1 hypothetical protein [Monosiga brevicollis MX1]